MFKSMYKFYIIIAVCFACSQSTAAIEVFTTLDEHRNVLTAALENAQKRVIIVSPYISNYAISFDGLIPKIEAAQDRGVQVVVYTDNRLDAEEGELKPTALKGRKKLASALSGLCVAKKVHAKVLIVDDKDITVGSFNWLSALRDKNNQHSNHEQSIRVTGAVATDLIAKSIEALDALELEENEYSVFYKTYQRDFLSRWIEGKEADAESYVELLGRHETLFSTAEHRQVSKLADAMDYNGNADEQLEWFIGKLEGMGIIDRIHVAAVKASFR